MAKVRNAFFQVDDVISLDPHERFTEIATVQRDKKGGLAVSMKGGLVDPQHKKYKQYVGEHGEILLVPIYEIPKREMWLYQNPEALASVTRGLEQAAKGDVSDLGDFTRFADEDLDDG